jgi:hypothetical protein
MVENFFDSIIKGPVEIQIKIHQEIFDFQLLNARRKQSCLNIRELYQLIAES